MKSQDWTTFTRRIDVNAPIPIIYKAWSCQEGIESWFLSKAKFRSKDGSLRPRDSAIQPGDQYTWMWHGADDVAHGEVIHNNGIDAISFTFLGCKVDVQITEQSGKHIVVLKQYDIPTDDESKMKTYVECTRGWTFFMANLKSILEGGIDLRNRDHNLNVINT